VTKAGSAFLGILAGGGVFLVLLGLGWILYQRLSGDSLPLLLLIGVTSVGAGLYGSWLLGWLVYSGLRASEDESGRQLP
jgi:hypothetical protein